MLKTFADIKTRVVALPGYVQGSLSQYCIHLDEVLGSGADGQVVRATIIDQELEMQVRAKYKYPEGPIVVALKLYGRGVSLLTDQDVIVALPDQDPDIYFRQEVSIMSSLQGHPSIATLIGYIEDDLNAIVMMMYDGSLSGLIDASPQWLVLPILDIA